MSPVPSDPRALACTEALPVCVAARAPALPPSVFSSSPRCADEVFQDCEEPAGTAHSTAGDAEAPRPAADRHTLTTAAHLFASALPTVEPLVFPPRQSAAPMMNGSPGNGGSSPAARGEGARTTAGCPAAPVRDAPHAPAQHAACCDPCSAGGGLAEGGDGRPELGRRGLGEEHGPALCRPLVATQVRAQDHACVQSALNERCACFG